MTSKTLVIGVEDRAQVPFLRGILTRSLQDAGLGFEDAYSLSSQIRDELKDVAQVGARDLQALVLRRLRENGYAREARRYRGQRQTGERVLVEQEDGRSIPFSRTRHQASLECSGLTPKEAGTITQLLYEYLLAHGTRNILTDQIGGLTHGCLEHELGEEAARRYLAWTRFTRSGRPLVILIGGTAGCGKSTTASALANRLDIVRTQSTDMLREIMRVMIPERILPALHRSSFDAWRTLPGQGDVERCTDEALVDGYRTQADLLSVASEAVVQRALRERVSLVLEGVHVNPSFAARMPRDPDAVVVTIMLAVLDRTRLRRYIRGRGREIPQRRAERYIQRFDEIWRLQTLLLDEADAAHIPIIQNDEIDQVFRRIMVHIVDRLAAERTLRPGDVFSEQVRRRHASTGA